MSNWRLFVPQLERWRGAVWIEIDRALIADRFISADCLRQQWDEGGHHRHTIMPGIEAAHIGCLPREAFCSAFLTWSSGKFVREINLFQFDEADYNVHLNDWAMSTKDELSLTSPRVDT